MTEHRFQVSAKNRDGLIIVVGGSSVEEMYNGLTDLYSGNEDDAYAVLGAAQAALKPAPEPDVLMQAAVREVQTGFGNTTVVPDVPEARNFRQRGSQPQAPALSAVSCKHGQPAKLVPAGVSKSGPKAGQPYSAFFACPMPRDSQCDFRQSAGG